MEDKAEIDILISGVSNETHLIYVSSYIEYLKKSFSIKKIEVIVGNAFLFNSKLSRENLENWLEYFELIDNVKFDKKFFCSWTTDKKRPLYHICVSGIKLKSWFYLKFNFLFRKIINVVVDEGLGSYSNIPTMMKVYKREKGYNKLLCLLLTLNNFYIKRGLLLDYNWSLYLKDMTVNNHITQFISNANKITNINNNKNYIMFLSQPWVELKLLPMDEYLNLIMSIKNIVEKEGIDLIIKPHPAEDFSKYNGMDIKLYHGKRPIEVEFDYIHCKGLIGFNSTALITINAIYNIESLRLDIKQLESILLSPLQKRLLDKHTTSIEDPEKIANWLQPIL